MTRFDTRRRRGRRRQEDRDVQSEPSDFVKKLRAVADEKEAEDAVSQEQHDPLEGYQICDKQDDTL